jgi:hypothetical protein
MNSHSTHWFSIRYLLLLIAPVAILLLLPLLAQQPQQTQAQTTAPDLFISEYVEGSSNNKAIEIYNATGASVDLSMYTVELYNNGAATPNQTLTLSGTLATEDVFVIGNPSAAQDILDVADATSNVTFYNGNDALTLSNSGNVIDMFGTVGDDPGSEWSGGGVSTSEATLRRKASVCEGDPDGFTDPSVEWESFAQDTFDGLGSHTCDDSTPTPTPTPAFIHDIQSSGPQVITGTYVITGVVVGDFQGSEQLQGFFVQEEDADADNDPATSEGIFVYCDTCPNDVDVGDQVEVTGEAEESFGMSQIAATANGDVNFLSAGNPLPTPATLTLPVPNVPTGNINIALAAIDIYYEPYEGMLVTISDTLTVAEYFQLSRYGQLVLSEGDRLRQFTDAYMPSSTGYISHVIDVARRTIILDDDDNEQNSALDYDDPVYHPVPGFSTTNFVRGGYTIDDLTGVLHWSWAGSVGTEAWRIRPVVDNDYDDFSYAFTADNPRPDAPTVDGDITVASFNVLNYFTTIDDGSNICGPNNDQGCRGANSQAELERQTTKIVTAMLEIDADIYGLNELENNDTTALQTLVSALNDEAGAGTYDFINTGAITSSVGSDVIKVGLIYDTTTVSPTGTTAVLNTPAFVDPNDLGDPKNRPAVAQAFQVSDSTSPSAGEELIVVVNHLKSKGSPCGLGDDDELTGQGNCNGTRTEGAQELANWLDTDPTGTGVQNVLITGDLNSYRNEDPIVALEDAGYTDLLDTELGSDVYTYLFDGQLGYLDYVLANQALLPSVVDVAVWNINADEVNLLDYDDTILDSGEIFFEEKPDANPLYEPNEYRSSDHDPVIVGLNLTVEESFDAYIPFVAN